MSLARWSSFALVSALVLAPASRAVAGEHPFETDALRAPRLHTGGSCVVRGVTIHSAVGPAALGDVLVRNGKIAQIGEVGSVDVLEIDGRGMHLAPGVVDCHSHTAIAGGVNEGTESITVDCDISDALDPDDVNLYRALAGGVTCARLLHGSANVIGGRHEVIKLKWHVGAEALRFAGAREGVKFALGENPKRSNGNRREERFPASRMGVEAVLRRAFERAREYRAGWDAYRAAVARGEDPAPPRQDVRLDGLAGVLDGSVDVHSHCYRADEILMLLRTAERFGFKIKTLQHVLEGYKVAWEIAQHGAMPSTFSDWWAYKIEAYDAIPFNCALLDEAGAVTSVNSDSDELMRHLYTEAAKAVRYGDMDPVRALRLATLNPAIQLGIDGRVGSIEVGKDADLVLLNGDPLSSLARVLWTMVDGEIQFERRDAFELESRPAPLSDVKAGDARARAQRGLERRPQAPGASELLALVGGTVHPVSAPPIEDGVVIVEDGRIRALGRGLEIPAGARVVDCSGQHVWPGVLALDTGLGLFEIGSVAGTVDLGEGGGNQADVRTASSLSAESAHIAVTRCAGVTRAQSAPLAGGPLRGQSCVIRLDGETWEDLLVLDGDMMHLAFPVRANDAKVEERAKQSDAQKELERLFEAARLQARLMEDARAQGSPAPVGDPKLEALAPFAAGQRRVAVHADNAQTILDALEFISSQGLDAVLYGVREGWKVVDELARAGVPCVVGPVQSLPMSDFDPYDAPYANAAVLHRAGVPFAFRAGDGENPRNVVFDAAMACAYGLPHDEAVRGLTLYAARVLGLEGELGSLDVGKRADLLVTSGDLLEVTSSVRQVFIDGVQQSMRNKQTQLHERFRERLRRLQGK